MTTMIESLWGGISGGLVTFLFTVAVKVSLLVLVAAVIASAMGRASATARHLVWALAIVAALAIPVVSAVTPFRLRLLSGPGPTPSAAVADPAPLVPSPEQTGSREVTRPSVPLPKGNLLATDATTIPPPRGPDSGRSRVTGAFGTLPTTLAGVLTSMIGSTWLQMTLVAIWLAGVGLVAGRQLLGVATLAWIARRATPMDDERWTGLATDLSRMAGLKRPVALLRSDWMQLPAAWGIWRPVVLLPVGSRHWTDQRRLLVLHHEMAHIRRGDVITLALARFACAAYWFNPLIWLATSRLCAESEQASDDWVLGAGVRASEYAGHLLDLVSSVTHLRVPATALPLAQRAGLEGRIVAILASRVNRSLVRWKAAIPLTALVAAATLLIAATTPAGANPRTDDPTDDGARSVPPVTVAGPAPRVVSGTTETQSRPSTPPVRDEHHRTNDPQEDPIDIRRTPIQAPGAGVAPALRTIANQSPRRVAYTRRTGLATQDDPRSVAALSEALRSDTDSKVRRVAAWALGQLGEATGVPALADAVRSDRDVEVRRNAVWALGQIRHASATEALGVAIRDADSGVRSTAVWAMGQTGDRDALPALSAALRDSAVAVRDQAAWALGQIGSPDAVDALVAALDDEDARVRRQATWALGQIGSSRAVGGLSAAVRDDTDEATRKQAAWALGQIQDREGVAPLAEAMRDGNAHVRQTAAWALGQIHPDRAPATLLEAVQDEDGRVREIAIWALNRIRDPAAVDVLRQALSDDNRSVKRQALRGLAAIGDADAMSAIADMLKDTDPEVRAAAAAALGGRHGAWPDPRPRPQPRPRPRPRPNGS